MPKKSNSKKKVKIFTSSKFHKGLNVLKKVENLKYVEIEKKNNNKRQN